MSVAARRVWLDGVWVPAGTPGVPVDDPGFCLGLGLFETMGAEGGELPLWEAHCRRLAASAAVFGLPPEFPAELRVAAAALLRHNGHEDGILRLSLAGAAGGGARWSMTTRDRSRRPAPVRLSAVRTGRSPADPTLAHKCASRAALVIAQRRALARGADDALLLDTKGRVLEAGNGNVFWIGVDRVLRTPQADGALLPGIARGVLLSAWAGDGGDVEEVDSGMDDLDRADVILVTNAVYGPRIAVLGDGAAPTERGAEAAERAAVLWRRRLDAESR